MVAVVVGCRLLFARSRGGGWVEVCVCVCVFVEQRWAWERGVFLRVPTDGLDVVAREHACLAVAASFPPVRV